MAMTTAAARAARRRIARFLIPLTVPRLVPGLTNFRGPIPGKAARRASIRRPARCTAYGYAFLTTVPGRGRATERRASRRGERAAFAVRIGRLRASQEEEAEQVDRIGDFAVAVAVHIAGRLAGRRLPSEEEPLEQVAGVRDVDGAVAVGVAAAEERSVSRRARAREVAAEVKVREEPSGDPISVDLVPRGRGMRGAIVVSLDQERLLGTDDPVVGRTVSVGVKAFEDLVDEVPAVLRDFLANGRVQPDGHGVPHPPPVLRGDGEEGRTEVPVIALGHVRILGEVEPAGRQVRELLRPVQELGEAVESSGELGEPLAEQALMALLGPEFDLGELLGAESPEAVRDLVAGGIDQGRRQPRTRQN